MKKYIIIIILLAVVYVGFYAIKPMIGAVSGTLHTQPERFQAGFSQRVLATSTVGVTSGTVTNTLITSDMLRNYEVFQISPTVASTTWTLPATSTLTNLLKNVGDTKYWLFKNAQTTTGITFGLIKGTGWDLTGIDANVDVIAGAAVGSEVYMGANCYRQTTKDIACLLTENIAAD